jgi:hypothetical protein
MLYHPMQSINSICNDREANFETFSRDFANFGNSRLIILDVRTFNSFPWVRNLLLLAKSYCAADSRLDVGSCGDLVIKHTQSGRYVNDMERNPSDSETRGPVWIRCFSFIREHGVPHGPWELKGNWVFLWVLFYYIAFQPVRSQWSVKQLMYPTKEI